MQNTESVPSNVSYKPFKTLNLYCDHRDFESRLWKLRFFSTHRKSQLASSLQELSSNHNIWKNSLRICELAFAMNGKEAEAIHWIPRLKHHYIVLFILFVVIIGICSVQVVSLRKISRELWKHAVVLFKHLPIVWHRTFWERASCLRKCRLAAKGRVFYYFLLELTISRMKMNNAGIMLLILFMYGILGWNVVYACASVTSEWHKPR